MTRVFHIVTHGLSANVLMRGQLRYLREQGFDVAVIASPGPELDALRDREGVEVFAVPMEREIAPLADLRALVALTRLLAHERPALVNASTPKGGLLGSMAAFLAGVPIRIYTLRGLRLETTRGWKRRVLATTERVAAACAHEVLCVSESLRARTEELRLVPRRKTKVLARGSSNGVDAGRFSPVPAVARALRERLGIGARPVVGFVGRLARDKGIDDLAAAFESLRTTRRDLVLLFVGDDDPGDPISPALRERLRADPSVVITGFIDDVAPYYGVMDVVAFPSRREGFPNVPLEAASAGVPVVGVRATGTVDAVVDGETGAIVPPDDPAALARALAVYLDDRDLRARHGGAARRRVEEWFTNERVWSALAARYREWLRIANGRQRGPALAGKRALDIAVASVGLVACSPVLAATALALKLSLDGGSVLFRQPRPGRAGQIFEVVKFRTMTHARDERGELLPDDARLTRVGRLVRSLSLDELPQLLNVVRGEMSLVGPRPLLVRYLDRYSEEQARRHEVLPGITGYAQIHGRNAVDWERRFALDVWYVDHWSLWLDLQILAATLQLVLRREGVSEEGQATMTEFTGSAWPEVRA
jgi:lipopolysaccharide/colanic/teichoic acid biosynthesis glycosyltransferase/glycosyltransferase involved in cell wall biosynthesis